MSRLIDADELIAAMKNKGQSLTVEQMNEEIERILKKGCIGCAYFGRAADAPEAVESGCMWSIYKDADESEEPPCTEKVNLEISLDELREILSRDCEYAATQDVVHQSFYEAMEELGGTGDWDEMAAEDLEGQMCELQSLFEMFYDKMLEKILNCIESYME